MKDNIALRKIRFFSRVPVNYVLYVEPLFREGHVKKSGLTINGIGITRAIDMQEQTMNFPEQKINALDNVDVILNTVIKFQIDGGATPASKEALDYFGATLEAETTEPEEEVEETEIDEDDDLDYSDEDEELSTSLIKSIGKKKRRAFAKNQKDREKAEKKALKAAIRSIRKKWKYNHPIEKYLKVRKSIIQEKEKMLDSEGPIESIVKEAVQSFIGTAPLEVLKNLRNEQAIERYCKDNNCEDRFEEFKSLKEKIDTVIQEKLANYGLKLNDFLIIDANYTKELNEEYNNLKKAQVNKAVKEEEAKAAVAQAKGESEAFLIKNEAKNKIYEQRNKVLGDADAVKTGFIMESPNMPSVTIENKTTNVNGIPETLALAGGMMAGSMPSYTRPTRMDYINSIKAGVDAKRAKAASEKNVEETETELFPDIPVVDESIVENMKAASDEQIASEPVYEQPINEPVYTTPVPTDGYFEGNATIEEVVEDENNIGEDGDDPKVYKLK